MTDNNWTFFSPNEGELRDIADNEASEIIGVDSDEVSAEAGARINNWKEQFEQLLLDENGEHTDTYHEVNGTYTGRFGLGISTTGVVTLLSNEIGNWYPTLSAGVGGHIECIPVALPAESASELCTTRYDQRYLPCALWVNEEFTYTTDNNGDRLALNPFASLLLKLQQDPFGLDEGEIHGDVVLTSYETDDEGNTLGLDWRAAYSLGFFLALTEPVVHNDDGESRRARQWRMIPNVTGDGYEFRSADPFATVGE